MILVMTIKKKYVAQLKNYYRVIRQFMIEKGHQFDYLDMTWYKLFYREESVVASANKVFS